jgi:hypothetical protein
LTWLSVVSFDLSDEEKSLKKDIQQWSELKIEWKNWRIDRWITREADWDGMKSTRAVVN